MLFPLSAAASHSVDKIFRTCEVRSEGQADISRSAKKPIKVCRIYAAVSRYVYVDTNTRRRSGILHLDTAAGLEDISADCRIGVDDHLTLYDLAQGQVCEAITYHADSTHPQLQVRLRHDQS